MSACTGACLLGKAGGQGAGILCCNARTTTALCQHCCTSHPTPLPVDKRLDEWVGQERVGSIAKAASADALHRVASGGSGDLGGDQKMTRRLKRQYTEILHVPAALEELPPIDQASQGRRAVVASLRCFCASAREAAGCWRGSRAAGIKCSRRNECMRCGGCRRPCSSWGSRAEGTLLRLACRRIGALMCSPVCRDARCHPPGLQHLEKEHQEKTKVKNIQSVELGRHEMDTWCVPAAAAAAASRCC